MSYSSKPSRSGVTRNGRTVSPRRGAVELRDTRPRSRSSRRAQVRGRVLEALHLRVLGGEVLDRVVDEVREPERTRLPWSCDVADRHARRRPHPASPAAPRPSAGDRSIPCTHASRAQRQRHATGTDRELEGAAPLARQIDEEAHRRLEHGRGRTSPARSRRSGARPSHRSRSWARRTHDSEQRGTGDQHRIYCRRAAHAASTIAGSRRRRSKSRSRDDEGAEHLVVAEHGRRGSGQAPLRRRRRFERGDVDAAEHDELQKLTTPSASPQCRQGTRDSAVPSGSRCRGRRRATGRCVQPHHPDGDTDDRQRPDDQGRDRRAVP